MCLIYQKRNHLPCFHRKNNFTGASYHMIRIPIFFSSNIKFISRCFVLITLSVEFLTCRDLDFVSCHTFPTVPAISNLGLFPVLIEYPFGFLHYFYLFNPRVQIDQLEEIGAGIFSLTLSHYLLDLLVYVVNSTSSFHSMFNHFELVLNCELFSIKHFAGNDNCIGDNYVGRIILAIRSYCTSRSLFSLNTKLPSNPKSSF